MNKLKKIYAVTSILFLILLAVSPLKEVFKDWKDVQNSYNEYIENIPFKVSKIDYGLNQIWNKDLKRTDRCISCHVSLNETKLNNAPQPFTSHPNIYHEKDIEKIGCTICHDGQGLATNFDDAHLPSEFWESPLLPTKYIKSACYRCHDSLSDRYTPLHNKGKELVEKFNCVSCHKLPDIKKQYTPDLNGIAVKIKNKQWLISWLKDPLAYSSNSTMPNFKLSNLEINTLADFLFSFKEIENSYITVPLPNYYFDLKENEEFINLGKTRFREARCISCHAVDEKGGKLAIDLIKIASKATERWIYNYIKNPQGVMPGVEMPQYGFTDIEVAAITAYIESEFVDWDINEDTLKNVKTITGYFEKGKQIFNKYNCAGCHKLNLHGISENKGPDLSIISSKKLYQIEWDKSPVKHTIYEYIQDKLISPKTFGPNTRMPQYNFNNEEIEAITAYLLSLRSDEIPQDYLVKDNNLNYFIPQGKIGKIFERYSCIKCHSVYNYGGKIAPDLTIVGSQLKKEWMREYFKVPYSLRAIVEERMPNLFIQSTEVDELINYFEAVLIDDKIDLNLKLSDDPNDFKKGEMLFKEKYGCIGCHIIDGSGGYVGPPLENVGDRLKPFWIYTWIKNPQKYKPDTIDPNAGLNEEELLLITTYLSNKRKKN